MTGRSRGVQGIVLLSLALLSAACAAKKQNVQGPPVFFPPAPGLPRIQYLTSLSGSKDVETQSAFNRFVVGQKQEVKLDKPYGIAIHDGKIYVCDTNATVVVFDLKQKVYGDLVGAVGPGKLLQPTNVSIEADGTKYVADPGRGQVVQFDANDQYVKAYGEPGPWRPVDAVGFEDRLYVADVPNHVVKVFNKATGELIKSIGDKGEPDQRLDRPTNLAFDPEGYLYVTDFGRFQVVKYDRDGHFVSALGRPGDGPGQFARPKGIGVDKQGRLYAVDASFNNVQVFDKSGRVLMYFGEGGEAPGSLLLPAKVTIDYDNLSYFRDHVASGFVPEYLILVTNQLGPRSVTVLAFGHEKGKGYPSDEDLLRKMEEEKRKAQESAPKASPPP
ncbi:MAG TPA: 6-bladed beta-propeller [Candidatus Polarisedimenticolaceae bacterium]|nr:6-bladed beta-propeller [Candidatus Polarisedimenticolaceae bacterium]